MALNLNDRIAVIRSSTMQARCTSAVSQYALYLLGNAGATVAQKGWATEAMRNPSNVGEQVSWHLLDDPNFLADGSSMTDVQLQGAVEAVINNRFIVVP